MNLPSAAQSITEAVEDEKEIQMSMKSQYKISRRNGQRRESCLEWVNQNPRTYEIRRNVIQTPGMGLECGGARGGGRVTLAFSFLKTPFGLCSKFNQFQIKQNLFLKDRKWSKERRIYKHGFEVFYRVATVQLGPYVDDNNKLAINQIF